MTAPKSSQLSLSSQRYKRLRAAACYAECAFLAGCWIPSGIESALDDKGPSNRNTVRKSQTGKYEDYLAGVLPKPSSIDQKMNTYPQSRLDWWYVHPIGLLLTDMSLGTDAIVNALDMVPKGRARQLVWHEFTPQKGARSRIEVPHDIDNIEALSDLGSADAMLAIIGRLRLIQARGLAGFDDVYEHALLDCMISAIATDAHLSIAKYILVPTIIDFLEVQCGWNERPVNGLAFSSAERIVFWKNIMHQIHERQTKSQHEGWNVPPKDIVLKVSGFSKSFDDSDWEP